MYVYNCYSILNIKSKSIVPKQNNSLMHLCVLVHLGVVWFMVLNTTFNYILVISWWSVLLVEETRVPGENHRPVVSH